MDNAELLQSTNLRFHFTADSLLNLPPYKGSVFHGAFGLALKRVAPPLYNELFDPASIESNGDVPKPFVLRPPSAAECHYSADSTLQCELILIGHAINHLSACICAMDSLGRTGIGKERGKLSLARVDVLKPGYAPSTIYSAHDQRWHPPPPAVTGAEIIAATTGIAPTTVTLDFQSHIRLQADNRLVYTPPPFHLFFSRVLGRLSMLARFHHGFDLLDNNSKQVLLEKAKQIETGANSLRWDDWTRYSGRQKTLMKFGGLLGEISYKGELEPFMPYLALGEWLHVGGKTSFGLGKYVIRVKR